MYLMHNHWFIKFGHGIVLVSVFLVIRNASWVIHALALFARLRLTIQRHLDVKEFASGGG